MRNIIIATSIVFIAVLITSYFYFSNLRQSDLPNHEIENTAIDEDVEDEISSGERPIWTFNLHAALITRPIVGSIGDTSRFILVQDAYHILYAISPSGQQLWNAQLPGPILGDIQQLADLTLVFTTAERLYRIDTDGDPLPGFSLQLPQRATGQGVTASHESAEDIRIDVQAGSRLLSFDARGRHLQTRTREANEAVDGNQKVQADTSIGLPTGCNPLSYYGPLSEEGNYLLCGKDDRKLYCYRYE